MEQTAKQAAQLLVEARRTGKPLRSCRAAGRRIPRTSMPSSMRYRPAEAGEAIGGWKIGFVYIAAAEAVASARYSVRACFASPARVPLDAHALAAHRAGDLVPPDARSAAARARLTGPRGRRGTGGLRLARDRRHALRHAASTIRQMLDDRAARFEACADHNTTGAYITAEGRQDWQQFDFAAMRMVMRTPQARDRRDGRRPRLRRSVPALRGARQRDAPSRRAARGELLVTGSFCGFFEVQPDEAVTAEFEGFGTRQGHVREQLTKRRGGDMIAARLRFP